MLHPAGLNSDGTPRMRRQTYPDLDALLSAWRATWGEAARSGMVAVGDLLDAYQAAILARMARGDMAQTTADDYTKCIASLRKAWQLVRIRDVDAPMLYRWQEARGAPVRANRERTVLFEAFKLAIRDGIVTDNPVRFLQPNREKPRDRYVTDTDFMAVYHHAPPVVRAAMLLAAVTGLRQGDILRIRRADFTDAGLTVRTSKTGKVMEFGWTEGMRRAVLEAAGAREFIPMVLLSTERGKPYTGDGFRSLWQRAITAALDAGDLRERYTFNDLRAKAGSESLDWKLLGHMDQRTFERVYNRLPRRVRPSR